MDVPHTNDDQFSMCAIYPAIYLSLNSILLHTERNMCAYLYRAEAPFRSQMLQNV